MAVAMNAIIEVEDELIALLSDDDQFVRAEALRSLAERDSPSVRRAIREMLLERNAVVQKAAENALQSFAAGAVGSTGSDNAHAVSPPSQLGEANP